MYRNYVVRVRKRDQVRRILAAHGIGSGVLYAPPLHLQTAQRTRGGQPGDLPVTEAAAEEILALPMFPELTDDEVAAVIDTL